MAIRWIFLVNLGACVFPFLIGSARAEANVGCIFSEQLCDNYEWCYNDNAFGRCLPVYGHIKDDDLYRYQLERDGLRLLEKEMRRLFAEGYRWSHAYTQCIIQNLLLSQRLGLSYDRSLCIEEENTDLDRALQLLEAGEKIAAQDLATIHFSPSKANDHSEYADELFIPPLEPNIPQTPAVFGFQTHFPKDETPTAVSVPATHTGRRKSKRLGPSKNQLSDNQLLALLSLLDPNEQELLIGDGLKPDRHLMRDYGDALLNDLSPEDLEQLQGFLESKVRLQAAAEDEDSSYNPEDRQMALDYDLTDDDGWQSDGTPNRWDIGFKRLHRYDVKKPGPNFMANLDDFDSTEAVVNEQLHQASLFKLLEEAQKKQQQEKDSQILDQELTAEGMQELENPEKVPENATDGAVESQKRVPAAPAALAREEAALASLAHAQTNEDTDSGQEDAKRSRINLEVPEALDQYMVTGPRRDDTEDVIQELYKLQRTNSFKKTEPIMFRERPETDERFGSFDENDHRHRPSGNIGEEFNMRHPSKISKHHHKPHPLPPEIDAHPSLNEKRLLNSPKKLVSPDQVNKFSQEEPLPSGNPSQFDVVDTTYAYIGVEGGFNNWKERKGLLDALAKLLDVEPNVFSNVREDGDEVTFKVNPNSQGLNASTVASKAESLKSELKTETGKVVTSVGIGDKTKIPVQSLEDDKKFFIITFVVCGCIAGVLIAVAVVFVIRRHARTKEKLQNLAQPETEASQDYQDLCRQRMANKSNEKPEPIHVAQRVTSLSRESETSVRSPSSRSSTSSWSEEPVTSNMDISTGHMVLSYMEDHLKNKDRLDQEWVALCAYEADPCSVTAATQPNNMKKNRYADVLPFDHSRVVLNDLTNIAGSDYINASSITDHDPRNPAYITTQGPLPQTSADFWQMIWEQGSVVIVMLTRLVENGVAMCHRYWPEEGSELYHIYEVHLVSEHIWCDDYLVRSFYLKNLKTGETRTVTQFHFLSWPDNGVPTSTKALLDFRRKVNKSYRGRSCPIVVHCSDGSGRSGTYCLIDMVLNRMAKGAKEIDIAATLEHIRDQRAMMVKTKAQFEFALMSVAEEVHAILKAIPQ